MFEELAVKKRTYLSDGSGSIDCDFGAFSLNRGECVVGEAEAEAERNDETSQKKVRAPDHEGSVLALRRKDIRMPLLLFGNQDLNRIPIVLGRAITIKHETKRARKIFDRLLQSYLTI